MMTSAKYWLKISIVLNIILLGGIGVLFGSWFKTNEKVEVLEWERKQTQHNPDREIEQSNSTSLQQEDWEVKIQDMNRVLDEKAERIEQLQTQKEETEREIVQKDQRIQNLHIEITTFINSKCAIIEELYIWDEEAQEWDCERKFVELEEGINMVMMRNQDTLLESIMKVRKDFEKKMKEKDKKYQLLQKRNCVCSKQAHIIRHMRNEVKYLNTGLQKAEGLLSASVKSSMSSDYAARLLKNREFKEESLHKMKQVATVLNELTTREFSRETTPLSECHFADVEFA